MDCFMDSERSQTTARKEATHMPRKMTVEINLNGAIEEGIKESHTIMKLQNDASTIRHDLNTLTEKVDTLTERVDALTNNFNELNRAVLYLTDTNDRTTAILESLTKSVTHIVEHFGIEIPCVLDEHGHI